MNRKIYSEYVHPGTGVSYGGDKDCDHDYPPESVDSYAEYMCWTCSKCNMKRCYDVFD